MPVDALPDLTPLLSPKSIAVVGASPDPARPGGRALAYLTRYGYQGTLYAVNPKHAMIGAVPCVPALADLPETPDMAVLAVSAGRILDVMREAQARGIPALTVYASGFAEIGGEGEALQEALADQAAAGGTLVCGPNSQGIANFLDSTVAFFTSELGFADQPVGEIGFVSQSGLFGGAMATEARDRDLGLGYLVSTGNEVVLGFAEVIAHYARDPRVRVIAGYLEGARDGPRLEAALGLAREAGKPVVILKAGRTAESARAAASHTGALAGTAAVYEAALRQWGAITVPDIETLYDAVEAFVRARRLPRGPRLGIVTNSGGIGVLLADAAADAGLTLAAFAPETTTALEADLPAFASARNPVDVTLQQISDADALERHARTLAADPGVDSVLVFPGAVRRHVAESVAGLGCAARAVETPLLAGWLAGDPEGPARLRAAGLTAFPTPRAAIGAIRALVDQACHEAPLPAPAPSEGATAAAAMLAAQATDGRTVLTELDAQEVLAAAGIPTAPARRATSAAEAVRAAEALGWPVALKIDTPELPHRSDVGGVVLSLDSPAALTAAYDALIARVRAARPALAVESVSVHAMVTGVAEMLVGVTRDATFGPVVTVGFGGTLVEVLRDTALRLPPIAEAEARAMLETLRGYPALAGARGRPPADIAALATLITRVADLARASEALDALDLNPVMVGAAGAGAIAADALITLRG